VKIGFWLYDYGDGYDLTEFKSLAKLMVASARVVMPGVQIIQLTDQKTEALVDLVHRTELRHYEAQRFWAGSEIEDDLLYVDVDVLFNKDVRDVFEMDFDVAVAERVGPGSKEQKFNSGVVFSKSPAFWRACAVETEKKSPRDLMWAQEAFNNVVREGGFKVKVLPSEYNFSPRSFVTDKAIVHYKGKRKEIMLGRR
jgi:lipopolysaccharide biosynthesis glycosyltransferase